MTAPHESPAERSIADALRSYAVPLGCPVGYLEQPRTVRLQRSKDDGGHICTFARGEVGVVSLPATAPFVPHVDDATVADLLEATRGDLTQGALLDVAGATMTLDDDPLLTLLDQQTLRAQASRFASLVYEPREAILDDLRAEVAPLDWREGGGDFDSPRRVGALAGGSLVALATMESPIGRLARLRVVVAPTFRRRGFGRLVLHELSRRVLGEGHLPHARLSVGNLGAHALASAVGFVEFARSLTMRMVAGNDYPLTTSTNP